MAARQIRFPEGSEEHRQALLHHLDKKKLERAATELELALKNVYLPDILKAGLALIRLIKGPENEEVEQGTAPNPHTRRPHRAATG